MKVGGVAGFTLLCDGYTGATCSATAKCSTDLGNECLDLYKAKTMDHMECQMHTACDTVIDGCDVVCGGA